MSDEKIQKLIELVKKYKWGSVIAAILVIFLITLATSKRTEVSQINNQTTPTPAENESQQTAKNGFGPVAPGDPNAAKIIDKQAKELDQNKQEYPLASKLPYSTMYFTIDHYLKPRVLVVVVKRVEDEDMVKQMVGKWLEDNGFKADSHTIEWRIGNP